MDITGSGKLYLVATPIGNLSDMTFRAVEVLKAVDLIVAEDTRVSIKLLKHYGIAKRMESFHQHNEASKKDKIIKYLNAGLNVAVVSDAGTPGISDPAFSLTRAAIQAGIDVVGIPGPSSVIVALITSGLPSDKFYFGGFPPVKSGQKSRFFAGLADRPETLIFFESPHRLMKTLESIFETLGNRQCAICRELTKKFEEVIRGEFSSILARKDSINIKGEFVLVIAGNKEL